MSRNLTGKLRQLTIFGQIEFIEGYEYDVDVKGNLVILTGIFRVVGTDDTEQLIIEMTKDEYINHLKNGL